MAGSFAMVVLNNALLGVVGMFVFPGAAQAMDAIFNCHLPFAAKCLMLLVDVVVVALVTKILDSFKADLDQNEQAADEESDDDDDDLLEGSRVAVVPSFTSKVRKNHRNDGDRNGRI